MVGNRRDVTVSFAAEGLYNVDFRATDAAGNVATVSDVAFGVDRTAPGVRLVGPDSAQDPSDPLTFPVFFGGDVLAFTARADDPDITRAEAFMGEAREHLAQAPPAWQAAALAGFNAYFFARHAAEPHLVSDAVEAALEGRSLHAAISAYLDIEHANGREAVRAIWQHTNEIQAQGMWDGVVRRAELPFEQLNTLFLGLL